MNEGSTRRATDFFNSTVVSWWNQWHAAHPKLAAVSSSLILSSIFLQLERLVQAAQSGSHYFHINPFTITANGPPVKVMEKEAQGRTRNVTVCVDSAVGGPLPILRLSTGATGIRGGGIRVSPGQQTELGTVPSDTELWAASDTAINVYVIERA